MSTDDRYSPTAQGEKLLKKAERHIHTAATRSWPDLREGATWRALVCFEGACRAFATALYQQGNHAALRGKDLLEDALLMRVVTNRANACPYPSTPQDISELQRKAKARLTEAAERITEIQEHALPVPEKFERLYQLRPCFFEAAIAEATLSRDPPRPTYPTPKR